jgi:DNA-binding beta-propeller fold protein YncE
MRASRVLVAALLLAGAWVGGQNPVPADSPDQQVFLPVRPIPVDGSPSRLVLDQDKLYVGCFHGENLTVCDIRSHRPIQKLHLDAYESLAGPSPNGEGVARRRTVHLCPPGDLVAANGKLFVGQVFSEFVVVFDLATMWVVKRIPVGGEGELAASADGKKVYFASNQKHEFYVIDTETYEVETVPYPAGGRGIGGVAVSPDQKRLYLGIQRGGQAPDGKEHGGGNSFLAVYDLDARRYAGTVYLAQTDTPGTSDDSTPDAVAFSPDGRQVYVGMFQSLAGIYVIDAVSLKVVRNIAFPANARNSFPWVNPVGLAVYRGWLLSANRSNHEVMVLDGSSFRVLARLTFAEAKHCVTRIVVTEDRIYLSDQDAGCVYELDGRKLAKRLQGASPDADKPLELTLDD